MATPTRSFRGTAAARTKLLDRLVRTEGTRFHWSKFWVAENVNGIVGALACYSLSTVERDNAKRGSWRPAWDNGGQVARVLAESLNATAPARRGNSWTLDHVAALNDLTPPSLDQLVEWAIAESRTSGCTDAYVEIPEACDHVKRAFANFGFVPLPCREQRRRAETYRDVMCMARDL